MITKYRTRTKIAALAFAVPVAFTGLAACGGHHYNSACATTALSIRTAG